MKIVSCNSNNQLSEEISKYLKKPLCQCSIKRFSDMEVFVEILENVRGEDMSPSADYTHGLKITYYFRWSNQMYKSL